MSTFIAGAYSVTWNSVTLGQLDEQGATLRMNNSVEAIRGQNMGDSVQDGTYQGGDCFIQLTSLEYVAGSIGALWPYGSLGACGIVGRLLQAISKPLVLTSTSGTPAASSPATLTASKAILAPGQNWELLFSTKLRKVPLMFQLLPYDDGSGNMIWFSTT